MGAEGGAGIVVEIVERPTPGVVKVRVRGEVGQMSCETPERLIRREIAIGARTVVLEAGDIESVDRDVAAMLASVGHDVALEIKSPSAGVKRSLEAAGFTQRASA